MHLIKKSCICLAFVLLGVNFGLSQSVFFDLWKNDGHYPGWTNTEWGWDIVELGPDRFLGIFDIDVRYNSNWDSIQVVEFSEGNPPRSIYVAHGGSSINRVIGELSSDSNYVYLGINTYTPLPENFPVFDIIKINLDGDLIWKRRIYGPGWSRVNDFLPLPNGNMIFCGESADYSLYDTRLDWMVGCIDPDGNVLWRKEWRGPKNDRAESMALNANGEIVIGGTYSYPNSTFVGGEATLQAINEDGTELWTQRVVFPTSHSGASSIAVNSLGEIYALVQAREPELAKFSPTGELIWHIPAPYHATIGLDLNENVCVGDEYHNGTSIGTHLLKYSPEGELILNRSHHRSLSIDVRKMKVASDGGVAYIGRVVGDGFFVKLNCQGEFFADIGVCSAPAPYDYPDVTNYQLQEDMLTAPMLGLEEGQSAAIEVYNLMGQKVATWLGVSDRNTGIDLTTLSESWYLYRLRSGEAVVKTGRLQLID